MSGRLSREQAIAEMVNGGVLYVYVESERWQPGWPHPGSGAIVGDSGLSHVGQRTVRALRRMGLTWDYAARAEVFTEDAKRRAQHGSSAIWFWR